MSRKILIGAGIVAALVAGVLIGRGLAPPADPPPVWAALDAAQSERLLDLVRRCFSEQIEPLLIRVGGTRYRVRS